MSYQPQTHDFAAGAAVGGAFAAFAAFLRALQQPVSLRAALVAAGIGLLFGGTATMLLFWQYPDVPFAVSCAAGAFVGYVSKQVSEVAVRVSDSILGRVEKQYVPGDANTDAK